MFTAKLVLAQSTRFEFNRQSLDVFTSLPLTPANLFAFRHPSISAKIRRLAQVRIV
jgi:hypothetical protein